MVRIITDSAAEFEPSKLREKDIICVPMQISFGDKEYKENENLTKAQFYELLESSEMLPKTSQPTPYDFETVIRDFRDNGDECVIITISSALSGTYQNAFIVKDTMEYGGCYIVDSLTATGGERLLVEEAARLRDSGKSAREIAELLEQLKGRVTLHAYVDTLEYLHKGGRLSKTAYTVASFANIKPLIYLSDEGKVEVSSKVLSLKSGINQICKKLEKEKPDKNYPMYIIYSNNRKNCDLLTEAVTACGFEIAEENIISIGATIGTHIGPNACGVVYVAE